jgi:phosphoenolpyruvate carboxykinase (ATP)
VNTGWSGGQYGVGQRMGIKHTRALLRAALDGSLARTRFRKERFFGLSIPEQVPGVPTEVLDPREAWSDKAAYDRMAKELVARFEKNFSAFEAEVGDEVRAAAIRAAA